MPLAWLHGTPLRAGIGSFIVSSVPFGQEPWIGTSYNTVGLFGFSLTEGKHYLLPHCFIMIDIEFCVGLCGLIRPFAFHH